MTIWCSRRLIDPGGCEAEDPSIIHAKLEQAMCMREPHIKLLHIDPNNFYQLGDG